MHFCSQILPQPQALPTTGLFTIPVVWPFLEHHRNGIIHHIALCVWLLSLVIMHLIFIRVVIYH